MAKRIKRVGLYARKSRDKRESLEGMVASLVDYAEKYGWEYELFVEEGSSSSEDWDRPELQRMIKKIEAQHFDAIVVTEQSRITRADEFPKFREILVEQNCLFVTTDTNAVYDFTKPQDEFMSDIMSAVSKQELSYGKIRLKRGTVYSAKKGNWLGKKSPIGYKYNRDTKKLDLSEDAPIIREMFELYAQGLSTKDIAHKFTNEGRVTTVGMKWSPAGVTRLLSNIVYAGHSLYGKTTQKKDKKTGKRKVIPTDEEQQVLVYHTHDPIVPQELYDEVQRIKVERASRPLRSRMSKNTFSSLIRCELCGSVHSFQTAHGRKRITSCQTRHYNASMTKYTICENSGANLENFERLFYAELSDYAERLEEHIDLIEEPTGNTEADLDSRNKQLKRLEQQLRKVQDGYKVGIYTSEEAQKEIAMVRKQMKLVEDQIKDLEEQDPEDNYVRATLDKIRLFMEGRWGMTEIEQNQILHEIVDFVLYKKVGPEMEIEVHWK